MSEIESAIFRFGQHLYRALPGIKTDSDLSSLRERLGSAVTDSARRQRSSTGNILDILQELNPVLSRLQVSELPPFQVMLPYLYSRAFLTVDEAGLNVDQLRRTWEFLVRLRQDMKDEIGIIISLRATATSKKRARSLTCDSITIASGDMTVVRVQMPTNRRPAKVSSDFFPPGEHADCSGYVGGLVDPKGSVFDLFEPARRGAKSNMFGDIIVSMITVAMNALEAEFEGDSVNHVAPLRAYPKRFYFLDYASTGSAQADNLVESLREDKQLLKEVNDWLKRFKIEVDVQQFKEIIHQLTVRRGAAPLDLDITDVGFGFSQVLPVIVQAYMAEPGSITLIEQPEIHLHPKMQADLADLFVAVTKKAASEESPRRLVIETHSEYLLTRLRRRIAEGQISSDDVGIYFVQEATNGASAVLNEIEIGDQGAFEWPDEFFEDSINDTLAFLQHQGDE